MKDRSVLYFLAGLVLTVAVIFPVKAQQVVYEPIKAQVGYDTAGCMYDWIRGSLNRGERDRVELVVGAVKMCGGFALNFGWTRNELVILGFAVLDSVPGVVEKKRAK